MISKILILVLVVFGLFILRSKLIQGEIPGCPLICTMNDRGILDRNIYGSCSPTCLSTSNVFYGKIFSLLKSETYVYKK